MGVWRCTFQFFKTDESTLGQNVLYFSNPENAMSVSQMGTELQDNWWVFLKPMISNTVRLEVIFFKQVDVIAAPGTVPWAANMSLGTGSFNAMHQVIGPVFQFFDGGSGPAHRGRMYPYCVSSNHLNRNGPQPSLITLFNTWRGQVLGRYGSPGGTSALTLNIWHRHPEVGNGTSVKDIRLAPRLGVQRRRNFGVGM